MFVLMAKPSGYPSNGFGTLRHLTPEGDDAHQKTFSDGELNEDAVCKKCLQAVADVKNNEVLFYNLDMIISLGKRNEDRA